jgi:hypothetical protein
MPHVNSEPRHYLGPSSRGTIMSVCPPRCQEPRKRRSAGGLSVRRFGLGGLVGKGVTPLKRCRGRPVCLLPPATEGEHFGSPLPVEGGIQHQLSASPPNLWEGLSRPDRLRYAITTGQIPLYPPLRKGDWVPTESPLERGQRGVSARSVNPGLCRGDPAGRP